MNGACDDFLAGSGLSGDQDGGAGGRYGLDLGKDGAQAAAASDDRIQKCGMWAIQFSQKRFIRPIKSGGHSLAFPIFTDFCKRA